MFRLRMIGSVNPKRIAAIIALAALAPLAARVAALDTSIAVVVVLGLLAVWEQTGRRRAIAAVAEA